MTSYVNGVPSPGCLANPPNGNDTYLCFFGQYVYSSVVSPLFIFQFGTDAAQLTFDQCLNLADPPEFQYAAQVQLQLDEILEGVVGVFSPDCFLHTIVTSSKWNDIKIEDRCLGDCIFDFLNGVRDPSRIHKIDKCLVPECNKTC